MRTTYVVNNVSDTTVGIGCRNIHIEEIENFFYWYFFSPRQYRFLLWSRYWDEPVHIYRSGRGIKLYGSETNRLYENELIYIFFKLFGSRV